MRMLARRLTTPIHPYLRLLNAIRTLADRGDLREFTAVRDRLRTDRELLSFHEGRSAVLPEFYHQRFEQRLGAYAELFPRDERTPVLDQIPGDEAGLTVYTPLRRPQSSSGSGARAPVRPSA